ncbi:9851_t:CDS:10 [Cetraspora pellucida]|uniref:9851_t:CDS:1 n=1 Tax=Cetraspora pellucida TaxID=1433469 RepID=A0A9N9AZ30_9GLOM|nr:9851_t:CDS:10 [Cetraspora pellucida]
MHKNGSVEEAENNVEIEEIEETKSNSEQTISRGGFSGADCQEAAFDVNYVPSKERINALKNNAEEVYLKLIDQVKDTRITHLLRQTDTYLESLTQAVVDQQNYHRRLNKGKGKLVDSTDHTDVKKIDYYAVAHRIQENVEQPNILIGGLLKDYQIKGLQWMVSLYNNHLNGILADEMGLEKTIQTISLIMYLIEKKKQNGPFLTIVPLSTMTNWQMGFEKWSLKDYVNIKAHRLNESPYKENIYVAWIFMPSYEECHSRLSLVLSKEYNFRYRLKLTGTPLRMVNTPFANAGGQDKIALNEEESCVKTFSPSHLKKDIESEFPDKVERVIEMTAIMDIMEDYLNWRHYRFLRLDGNIKAEERTRLLKDLMHCILFFFSAHVLEDVGGLELNLQSVDIVIIFDSDWNLHQDLQVQDRVHRIGQTNEVRILRLISQNSIEETVLARTQYKLDIDGKVIQAGKFDQKSTPQAYLFILKKKLVLENKKLSKMNKDSLEQIKNLLNQVNYLAGTIRNQSKEKI